MQYRFAHPDEIPKIARLVAHSFIGHSAETWMGQLRDPPHGGGPETLFVGFDENRPVAALLLHPLKQWVAGSALPMAGVGLVTVSPTHRQQGLAAELMKRAVRAARERGDVASALFPFRTSFYQKSGYGMAGEVMQYLVPPAAIPAAAERERVELLETEPEHAEALALYHEWIRGQNGQIERRAEDWARRLATRGVGLVGYRSESGELEGYALVVYPAELPAARRYLDVMELVWTSPTSRRGLFGWLASLGDQWQRIMLRGLPSHRLGDILNEPRLVSDDVPLWGLWMPSAVQLVGPMFRLLDVQAAWARRATVPGTSLSVSIQVTDKQIEENNRDWHLSIENGRANAKPGTGGALELRMDISTLSRLFIGALKPTVALEVGLLECDRPEQLTALDAALALPEPWMFDRF